MEGSSRGGARRVAVRSSLKEAAVDEIRRMIFAGDLPRGSRIDQEALAADLGMSKLPVREALITLEAESLVHLIARRGAYVATLSRDEVEDHFHIFGSVAALAAERAAHRLSDAELGRLDETLDAMRSVDDPQELQRLNAEFHRLINVASGSRPLVAAVRRTVGSLPGDFYRDHELWADQADEDHQRILDALRARDASAARSKMEEHLAGASKAAVRLLEESGFWDSEAEKNDLPVRD